MFCIYVCMCMYDTNSWSFAVRHKFIFHWSVGCRACGVDLSIYFLLHLEEVLWDMPFLAAVWWSENIPESSSSSLDQIPFKDYLVYTLYTLLRMEQNYNFNYVLCRKCFYRTEDKLGLYFYLRTFVSITNMVCILWTKELFVVGASISC